MDFLQGFTQCWWPGPSCHIDWTAWAAIGTVAGVLLALFGPKLTRRARERRVTAHFAAAFQSEILQCSALVARLKNDFRLGEEHQKEDAWAIEGILMAENDGRLRIQLFDSGKGLTFADKAPMLAQWSDIDPKLALVVAKAIGAVWSLRTATAQPVEHPEEVERDWTRYFSSLRSSLGVAELTLDIAHKSCERAMIAQD